MADASRSLVAATSSSRFTSPIIGPIQIAASPTSSKCRFRRRE